MEEAERLKRIIDELLAQNQGLSLERAIARGDLRAALEKIENLEKTIEGNKIHTVTTKE